ncbi:MAG: glycerate kinase [Sedimentisphaerales bacterium]|nr:glycerate kinase [Sedimentisphaerales bacterium]
MKIVIAMDSFKGTLKAHEACDIVAQVVANYVPDAKIVVKPMADGGEGTARAMIEAVNGRWIPQTVMGPVEQMRIEAGFAWFDDDKTALVEMASASGLELLSKSQMDPIKTTTFGTGELIAAALDYGAEKILLAVGGSSTVDGGVGAAMALGWKFLDGRANPISLGGAGLEKIAEIIKPRNLKLVPLEVLCDVDNPLCGSNGAARIYGPQKGATPEMIEQLEKGLKHLANLVSLQLNKDIKNVPGAGAAGGLAAGALSFMNARLVSGIDVIMHRSKLHSELKSADWIITGEGSFDRQSLYGKVVSGISKIALQTGTRIAVLAGQVTVQKNEYHKLGIVTAIASKTPDISLDYALDNSRDLLCHAAEQFVKEHL